MTATTPSAPWLNAKRVAALAGISVRHFYALLAEGSGPPSYTFGRKLQFKPEDVDAWIAEHRRGGPKE